MHPVLTQWHTEALLAERHRQAADHRLARAAIAPRRREGPARGFAALATRLASPRIARRAATRPAPTALVATGTASASASAGDQGCCAA